MSSKLLVAVYLSAVSLLPVIPWVLAQSSPSQTPPRNATGQQRALTPQEREAQKHYRIAQEALKNNDLNTASDELKTAADLAPKNALIWYNLAIVESKKGESSTGLEHLQKAEVLGIPKSLQNEADQLEAKLAYEMQRQAKKEAFNAKLPELQKNLDAQSLCDNGGAQTARDWRSEQFFFNNVVVQNNSRKVTLHLHYTQYNMPTRGPAQNGDGDGIATFDLAELSPDVSIQQQPSFCMDGSFVYVLVIKSKSPAAIHFNGKSSAFTNPPTITPWVDGDAVVLKFPKQESAQAAAKTLSELIRMSPDIQ
jgi:tetratricopeptide (TPR) repeat protein